ncbi:MAG TPA: hypothetical protein VLL51_09055, partial [Gemmatimonadales bacterium]|nr:hypothetical protein [Gemmatimonadales bacterium]
RMVDGLLEQEHGPLLEALPPAAAQVVEQIAADLGPRLADRLAEWARTPEFAVTVGGLLARLRDDVGNRPVGDLLTPATREALSTRVDGWVQEIAEGEEMEAALRRWVTHQMTALERDPRPLIDRLPPGLLAPVEQAIEDYLPTAIDRLSGLLGDPETRTTISSALRTAFDGAARQLLLHERLLAKLVVKPETFDRLLDGIEVRGFEKFAAAITAPAVRSRLASALHQSLLGLLRMPLGERLARLGPEKRESLDRTLGDWAVNAARSPATRTSVQHVLERGLDLAGERTWGDVLALVPEHRAATALADALDSEAGRAWVAETVRGAATRLLARPIGRPADWLGPETTAAVR